MAALFHVLFFASGFSALLYQVVWARQLSTVFGVSAFAMAAVLSAYFLGMALGAWWIGRRADRLARPLAGYGVLEAGASLLAIAITIAIPRLDALLVPVMRDLEENFLAMSLVRFAAALAVLVPPTMLLGATLPMLARGLVAHEAEMGPRVAQLYAVNTAGAVAGVLAAGFALIPALGLRATAFVGAAIGLAVAVAAVLASRRLPSAVPAARTSGASAEPRGDAAVLLAFGVSGFAALALEVVVLRLLGHLQSSSTLAISGMLAVFLTGIALGSAFAGRRVEALGDRSGLSLAMLEAAIGGVLVASFWLFATARGNAGAIAILTGEAHDALVRPRFAMLAAAMVFAPPTLLLGATFPLAARAYVGSVERLGTHLGRLYAANTLGGVVGSFVAGFLLIPALGAERSLTAIALLFCVNGALLAVFVRGADRSDRVQTAGRSLAVALIVLALRPDFVESWLLERSGSERVVHAREDYYGTVAVVERSEDEGAVRQLMLNGDFMSNTSEYALRYMRLASHLPALLVEGTPRRGLVICFGAGITVDALASHPGVEQVTVVELSAAVLESARYFEHVNRGVLARPNVEAVVGDGRRYLARRAATRFDVITLEPPPPAGAGIANLYSRDFYELARTRLAPGGVMAQWIPIATQSPEATRSLLRAFTDVFPHAALWWTESLETLVVGSDRPLHLDLGRVRALLRDPNVGPTLREIGIEDEHDLVSYYLLGEAELAAWLEGAVPVTDDLPLIEYVGAGTHDENWRVLEEMIRRRPEPAALAARFTLPPSDTPRLVERLERRLRERVKTGASETTTASGARPGG